MKSIKHILAILFLSVIIAVLNYFLNPNRPSLGLSHDEVTLRDIASMPNNLIIVDARKPNEYKMGHIYSAINLSEEEFDSQLGEFLDVWNPDSTILVYCNPGQCNSSRAVAERLKNECQIKNVFVLKDDWKKWKTLNQ